MKKQKTKGIPKSFLRQQVKDFAENELASFAETNRYKYEQRKTRLTLEDIIGILRRKVEDVIDNERISDPVVLRSDMDMICTAVKKGKREARDRIHKGNTGLSGIASALSKLIEQKRSSVEEMINENYDLVSSIDENEAEPTPDSVSVFGIEADPDKSLGVCMEKLNNYLISWFEGFREGCCKEALIGPGEEVGRDVFVLLERTGKNLSQALVSVANSVQALKDAGKDCSFETFKEIVTDEFGGIAETLNGRNGSGVESRAAEFIKEQIEELTLDMMGFDKDGFMALPADNGNSTDWNVANMLLPAKTAYITQKSESPDTDAPPMTEGELEILRDEWRTSGSVILVFRELKRVAALLNDSLHGGLEYRDVPVLKKYFGELQSAATKERSDQEIKALRSVINEVMTNYVRAIAHKVSEHIASGCKKERIHAAGGEISVLLVPKNDLDDFSSLIKRVYTKVKAYFETLELTGDKARARNVFITDAVKTADEVAAITDGVILELALDEDNRNALQKEVSGVTLDCSLVADAVSKSNITVRPNNLVNFASYPASLILGARTVDSGSLPMLEEERKILARLKSSLKDSETDIESKLDGWAITINDTLHGGYPTRKASDLRKWLSALEEQEEESSAFAQSEQDGILEKEIAEAIAWVKGLKLEEKKVVHQAYRRLDAYASLLEENLAHLTADQIRHLVMEIETAKSHYVGNTITLEREGYKALFLKSPNTRTEMLSVDHVSGRLNLRLKGLDEEIARCEHDIIQAKMIEDSLANKELSLAENEKRVALLQEEIVALETTFTAMKRQYVTLIQDAQDPEAADRMDDLQKTMENNLEARRHAEDQISGLQSESDTILHEFAKAADSEKISALEEKLSALKAKRLALEERVDQLIKESHA